MDHIVGSHGFFSLILFLFTLMFDFVILSLFVIDFKLDIIWAYWAFVHLICPVFTYVNILRILYLSTPTSFITFIGRKICSNW